MRMHKEELLKLIKKGENQKVEFKESLKLLNEIGETLSAFSNTCSGIILIGISDSGKIIGVSIGKNTIEEIVNYIKRSTDPQIYPSIKVEKLEGKEIILVEVLESKEKPVFFKRHAYKRVGKTNLELSSSEIRRLVKESGERVYWDEQICREASSEDIDWNFVKDFFIPKYESLTKREIVGDDKELLEALGCIKEEKPRNAAILLFGKEPQKFFRNSYIALARYKGDVESTERLDYKEFTGNLFQQIDACDKYIKERIAIMSRLHPMNVEREDIPEYPLFSIRELIVNAVCHRDYSDQGSKVIIKMFNNYITYYNPGGLPEGITPKNILKMQKSRNPIIARVLAKIKYIEELGEGWNKIVKEFKIHPLRPKMPELEDFKNAVLVTIHKAVLDIFERFKNKLNERQIKLIKYLQMNEFVTSAEHAKMFGITDRQAREDLSKMVLLNLLIKEGKARLTKYKLYPEISGNIRKLKRS